MTKQKVLGIAVACVLLGGLIGSVGYAMFGPEKTKEVEVRVLVTPSPLPSPTSSVAVSADSTQNAQSADDAAIRAATVAYCQNSDSGIRGACNPVIIRKSGRYAETRVNQNATVLVRNNGNGRWEGVFAGPGSGICDEPGTDSPDVIAYCK